ncbi:unnamed protein product [Cylindrotheca closterium]|uniref:PDZ domain-containing protein n=1 Tax=Cylindrotheca closterium TaxID=2856 RepID=A0AAD2CTG7_9STRA|nr:unnamed protein product [Cylindrotheca closterium]
MRRTLAPLLVVIPVSMVYGDIQSTNFGVRSLRRHPRNNPSKGRQGILTHSDDGRSKIMTAFFLDIFETQGEIEENSFPVVRLAMNNFLLAEMNAIYEPQNNELDSVSSSLIGYPATIEPSGQINKMGTEMLMEIKMTFDNEPSPDIAELEVVIREVMSDLSLFVTNLTRFEGADFYTVTEAYRREIPTAAPSASLAPSTSPVQKVAVSDVISDVQPPADESALTPEQIAVPAILIGATFLAVILFLLVRRRKRSNPDLSKSGDQILTDIEGGAFSFDKSLDSHRPPSPEFPSSSVSELGSQDSVFSDNIADASKRLKTAPANTSGAASQATVPSSNRMYNLLNFMNENEDLYAPTNGNANPTDGRPLPPAAVFERDGSSSSDTSESHSSSKNSFAEIAAYTARTGAHTTGNGETLVERQAQPPRPGNSRNAFSDIANFTACTSNGGGRDPTPRSTSLERKTQSTSPGGLMGMFHCAPTGGAVEGGRNNQERIGRSPERRIDTGNEAKDIFRPRSRSGTPSKHRSSSQSRNSTPNRSRPSTPTRSRPSTPINDHSRHSSNSPSAGYQRMGNSGAMAPGQGSNGGTRNYARKPAYLPSNDPQSQRHPFQDVNLRTPDVYSEEKKDEGLETPDRKRPVFIEGMTHEIFYPSGGRRHAGNNGVDGSAMYQANAMDPSEWSYKSYDNNSVGNSTISDVVALPKEVSRQRGDTAARNGNATNQEFSPHLEEDTEWIEKRIAAAKQYPTTTPNISIPIQHQHSTDSLSYASNDKDVYNHVNSPSDLYSSKDDSVMSSIVCRDCYAPPGKLNIVIHSTKDGPAVHTVKPGSSLEGHLFPGDLIISVDNVDTRSFTAEHVMKMMAAKSTQERKITVLHFEEESQI